ncbi:MAG: hypothetical protein H7Y01_07665 [Ferruginibacter sp.]|nr:hypothetical protein [Chitinophagaceae bacterium]
MYTMVQRLCCFLVVFLLMFPGEIFGQDKHRSCDAGCIARDCFRPGLNNFTTIRNPKSPLFLNTGDPKKTPNNYERIKSFNLVATGFEKQSYLGFWEKEPASSNRSQPVFTSSIGSSYYTNQLGYFCKKELQLDKITPVPIRFRLGSMEYVNWMEQKQNAIKPN